MILHEIEVLVMLRVTDALAVEPVKILLLLLVRFIRKLHNHMSISSLVFSEFKPVALPDERPTLVKIASEQRQEQGTAALVETTPTQTADTVPVLIDVDHHDDHQHVQAANLDSSAVWHSPYSNYWCATLFHG